jgi:PAS domain S-box-containing protein
MPPKLGAAYSELEKRIAELVEENDRLRRNESRFRLMVESVPDYAIYMLDTHGRVTSWNEGARRLEGHEAAEIVGQHYERFFIPEDVKAGVPARGLQRAREEGRYECEGWRVRKDGSRFFAHAVLTPIEGAGGVPAGFAKITRDLTQWKLAEDSLQAAHALFGQVGKALKAQLRATEPGVQVEELIEDLLDLTTILNGQLKLELGVFDAAPVVQAVAQRFHDRLLGKLKVQVSPAVGRWDAKRLDQALSKLLANVQHHAPGAEVRVSLTARDGRARLEVADGGPGISAELLPKLFVRPVPSARMGIGLFVCRRLVEAHGGSLAVGSEPGKGARFVIELPMRAEAKSSAAQ